jgi:DNA-binding transcriptional LysR family regulator
VVFALDELLDPETGTRAPLLVEPLVLAVPTAHPLAGRALVALCEAAGDDFVMLPRTWDLRSRVEELCVAAGFEPRVSFEVDDLRAVQGFVVHGLGVAVVPAPAAPGGARTCAERFRQHVLDSTRRRPQP